MTRNRDLVIEPYTGIYEVSQAARMLNVTINRFDGIMRINNRHILRWIRKGLALPQLSEVPGNELYISFPDLISMRVVALLRAARISWKAIYRAEDWLRQHTQSPRPFATQEFWTAAREIFVEHHGQLLAASMGGQLPFVQLIGEHLLPVAGLTFDEHGIAASWAPMTNIVLRPSVQFGAACIRETRITTEAIWGMNQAGDSPDFIAKVFRLDKEKVEEAISWENRLALAA